MKHKLIISLLLLSGPLVLNGCSASSETASEESSEPAVTDTTAETETTVTETTRRPPEDYVHGEDGYYCLKDEMPEFKMENQIGGTCWLYAGTASMESAYCQEYGSYMKIDPMNLLDIIYLNEKEDGFILQEHISGRDTGGWQWMITETLSRGFGDLTIDSTVILDETDRKAIQENIRTRGAVAVELPDNDDSKKAVHGMYYTMNDTESGIFDHDIAVIGWDDHFPKEYFNEPAEEDGAWITYNSGFSADKYYYVSYCTPFGYALSHRVTDQYGEVLSYDAGTEEDTIIRTGDSTKTANVFHKTGRLAAVGTYNHFDTQDIRIEIYDSSFTDLLYAQDAVLDYHGYHTVKLSEPVDVTDYAIVITYSKGAPVEGETNDYDGIVYTTFSESGESFVYADGWKDVTDADINEVLGINFNPNNCCIKALYAKE